MVHLRRVAIVLAALILAGMGSAAGLEGGPPILRVTFHPPSDTVRFYYAEIELGPTAFAFDITETAVDGRPNVFVALVNGQLTQTGADGRVSRPSNGQIPSNTPSVFRIRCPWTNGATCAITLRGRKHADASAKAEDEPFAVEASAIAPASGGFPFPGWQEHRVLVLREDFGIARTNDPYLLFLSDEGRRVASFDKELRVARYNPADHSTTEIPSQVLYEKRRLDTPQQQEVYTTCEAAFLVDVPAKGKSYYLIAYGNPAAAKHSYTSDLSTREEDGATWVENEYYQVQLHPQSGQINGFRSKSYGTGEQRGFGSLDPPLPPNPLQLHYNPDVWVKGRPWTWTHGWNPPPHQRVEAGPVAVVTRRWGHLPNADEVEVEVVYHFFSHAPYVLIESTMDIVQDVAVNALRNEEVVFMPSATSVDHAGWRRPNGELGYKAIVQEPGLTPGMVQILEPDAPYVCMVREGSQLGMASIRLNQHAGSRGDESPVIAATKTVLADYGWNFRYWSRSLAYPWGDYVPDHPVVLNAGTYYGERSAFCLFPLGKGKTPAKRLAYLQALYQRLTSPIRVDEQGAGPW